MFAQEGEGGTRKFGDQLSEEEKRIVRELKRKDAEVRRHERAHAAAAGPYASPPNYKYVRGPDGNLYAIDGEVKIDANPESSPEGTIQKMEIIIRAAMAPANPSPQDRAVAAKARQHMLEAERELQQKKRQEQEESGRRRDGLFAVITAQEQASGGADTSAATGAYIAAEVVRTIATEAQRPAA